MSSYVSDAVVDSALQDLVTGLCDTLGEELLLNPQAVASRFDSAITTPAFDSAVTAGFNSAITTDFESVAVNAA